MTGWIFEQWIYYMIFLIVDSIHSFPAASLLLLFLSPRVKWMDHMCRLGLFGNSSAA